MKLLENLFITHDFFRKLDAIESGRDCVLWIRDSSYKKQLYVSQNYERIWERSCKSLYDAPDEWLTFLVSDDQIQENYRLSKRNTPINPSHTEVYCFATPSGEHRWVQDRSFRLHDEAGSCQMIAGVSLLVSEDTFQKAEAQEQASELLDDIVLAFSHLLTKTFSVEDFSSRADVFLKQFTEKEKQVLSLILLGKTSKMIARELDMASKTADKHCENIREKLGASSKSEVIIQAIEHNLLQVNF